MMATNPRWCQPVRVWRDYFRGLDRAPDPMAQMLASVMFDLRPIGGTTRLFTDLQAETLDMAAKNSIFVAHMIANAEASRRRWACCAALPRSGRASTRTTST
jgi:CBS domain-containing protein